MNGFEDFLSLVGAIYIFTMIGSAILIYGLFLICSPCICFVSLRKLWKLCRRIQQQRHEQSVVSQEDKQDNEHKEYPKSIKVERPVPTPVSLPAVVPPVSTNIPTVPEYVNRGQYYSTRQEAYDAAKRDGGGREPLRHPPHSLFGSHHYHVHGHEIINGVNMHYNFDP